MKEELEEVFSKKAASIIIPSVMTETVCHHYHAGYHNCIYMPF